MNIETTNILYKVALGVGAGVGLFSWLFYILYGQKHNHKTVEEKIVYHLIANRPDEEIDVGRIDKKLIRKICEEPCLRLKKSSVEKALDKY